jgi:anti-sigma factor RsiW
MSTIDPPEELLSAYLDDELPAEERALVEHRLEESGEWRAVLEEVRETRELLHSLPVREAPTGFWDSLLQPDIAPPVQLGTAHGRRGKRALSWLAGAAAAAAIVAVVVVPGQSQVKPAVATLVNRHALRSSVSEEPVSQLAPVTSPVQLNR